MKDTIIIRGVNHHAEDVEWTMQRCHPGLADKPGAAFAVDSGAREDLVIVHEVDARRATSLPDVIQTMRDAIARSHELDAAAIVLVGPGSVPRTSSGKIRRAACRAAFLEGSLTTLSEWRAPCVPASAAALLESLASASTLASPAIVDLDDKLSRYGLDSLGALELAYAIEKTHGVHIGPDRLLTNPRIRELAEWIAESRARGDVAPPSTSPASIEAPTTHPASVGQRALWTLWQGAPESGAYNIAAAVRIRNLDARAFERAATQLAARHASLRASFEMQGGLLVERVHDRVDGWFAEIDGRAWSEATLRGELARDADRPFDLTVAPLFRIRVIARPSAECAALVVVHHSIADGWSMAVIAEDLCRLYAAEKGGAPPPLPAVRGTSAELADWQASLLASAEGERLWEYWQRRMSGAPPGVPLPTDRPRSPVRAYRGGSACTEIGAERLARLSAFASSAEVTLNTVLLSAWQIVLRAHSGQDDIVVGSPVAGRPLSKWDRLVGCFVNAVVLRSDLSGHPSLIEIVRRTHETMLGALAHQQYPFSRLVERLRIRPDASDSPLFNVLFAFQKTIPLGPAMGAFAVNAAGHRAEVDGVTLESLSIDRRVSQFDLALAVAEVDGRLIASATYDSELFTAGTITRMLRHFDHALQALTQHSDRRLGEVSWLPEIERVEMIESWNHTFVEYPDEPVHVAIERRAALTPTRTAVTFEDRHVTYGDLNAQANRLARHLRSLGVGPERHVAICLDRSIGMVVALLAVLKAGAAYLPLDPEYPPARLAYMRADAEVAAVVTEAKWAALVGDDLAPIVWLDDALPLDHHDDGNLDVAIRPDHLAYVIYTSGSTGAPKGAMNTHRGLTNRLRWMQDAFDLGPDDAVLHKTSVGFDVSVWELFWPLMAGARLVLARPGAHRDPVSLSRLIADEAITTVHFVPSMLRVFLDAAAMERCRALRRVVCSGEPLTAPLQRRFFSRLGAALHNLYGPTEAAIDVTWWPCQPTDEAETVPIGRPIANTAIYLLDRDGQPTPVGVPGELCIGGVGLARGYVRRPALTADRFVPDPFGGRSGVRLYRTGDLARYRADGAIEYLGRTDQQIKLRGQRIELGEIETALVAHPAIKSVAVLLRSDDEAEPCLCAYVEGVEGVPLAADDLRAFLKSELPSSMIPAAFVFVPSMPTTTSGKLDRRRLAEMAPSAPETDARFEAPRTALELVIAKLWKETLGVAKVSVHDDFFALGGHSLTAAKIAMSLQAWYPTETPILTLLVQHPTIARLAAAIAESPGAQRRVAETATWLEHASLTEELS